MNRPLYLTTHDMQCNIKIEKPCHCLLHLHDLELMTKLSCFDVVRQYKYYLIKYIGGYQIDPTIRAQPESDTDFDNILLKNKEKN